MIIRWDNVENSNNICAVPHACSVTFLLKRKSWVERHAFWPCISSANIRLIKSALSSNHGWKFVWEMDEVFTLVKWQKIKKVR